MDDASHDELLRFAAKPFRAKADARLWPEFLLKDYRAAKARLKTSKLRYRVGGATRATVDENEQSLAQAISTAKEWWLEARKTIAPKPLKRRSPTSRHRPKEFIDDPRYKLAKGGESPKDGSSKIDRSRGVSGILVRTRQLENLDITSKDIKSRVAEFIRADLRTLRNYDNRDDDGAEAPEDPSNPVHFARPDTEEWPNPDAHVLAWKRFHQRTRVARTTRVNHTKANSRWAAKSGSSQMRRITASEQAVIATEGAEHRRALEDEYLATVDKRRDDFIRFLSSCERIQELKSRGFRVRKVQKRRHKPTEMSRVGDRLCSAVSNSWQSWWLLNGASAYSIVETSLLPGELSDVTPTERTGFLMRYNPNRRRL